MELSGQEILTHACKLFHAEKISLIEKMADECMKQSELSEVGLVLKIAARLSKGEFLSGLAMLGDETNYISSTLLAARVGRCLLDFQGYQILTHIHESSSDRIDHAIWLYFGGCARMMSGNVDGAFECFDQFKGSLRSLLKYTGIEPFLEDVQLNLILRQGSLCFGPIETSRRIEIFEHCKNTPELLIRHFIKAQGPVFATSCDGSYFRKFAHEFTHQLLSRSSDAVLHLHVSNPDAETEPLFSELMRKFPERLGLGLTLKPPYVSATYFTCERFFVVERLLEEFNCPIVTLDIDVTPTKNAPNFHWFAEKYDFACYETGRNEPASVCQASVMSWGVGQGAREFLRAVQAYCFAGDLESSTIGSWMLDQAAIFSVRNYFRKRHPTNVTFGNMKSNVSDIDDALTTFALEEDKRDLKSKIAAFEPKKINI